MKKLPFFPCCERRLHKQIRILPDIRPQVTHTLRSPWCVWWCMAKENPNRLFGTPSFLSAPSVSKLKLETLAS